MQNSPKVKNKDDVRDTVWRNQCHKRNKQDYETSEASGTSEHETKLMNKKSFLKRSEGISTLRVGYTRKAATKYKMGLKKTFKWVRRRTCAEDHEPRA